MKKIFTAIALTCLLSLTSCGSGDKMAATERADYNNNVAADVKGDYMETAEGEYSDGENAEGGITQIDYKQSEVKTINTQMLVYSCDMSIDVLEFDDSVDKFHELINKYKGFIESENYSDGGSSSQWQYAEAQKWKTLTATIRIPSADYDNFCKDAEAIGDMRRKNASVQNLTTEYSDLKTTLSIYEAKEQRYLDILKDITDEKQAVAIEEELTNIQIEIARIKTRMNSIEGDVAYSYINLTLNEVREYTEEPVEVRTDTFGQRLGNTVSHTWKGFLEFLEEFLFFIIKVFPYAIILAIALFIISKLKKAFIKKHTSRMGTNQPIVTAAPPAPAEQPVPVEQPVQQNTESNTENKTIE